MDFETFKKEYRRRTFHKYLFILLCLVFVVIMGAVSITIGAYDIDVWRVYETIFEHIAGVTHPPDSKEALDDVIVWYNRLPRVLLAVLAGVGLAISGVAMQSLMKNPLAEPYTTGVSSGAYLGVAISMALGLSMFSGSFEIPGNAFLFALIPVTLIVISSSRIGDSVATVILMGTALSYLFNAVSTLILVSTDAETLSNVYKWQVGTIVSLSWEELRYVAAITLGGSFLILLLSKKLNVLAMGDNNAKSLGLNVNRLRMIILVVMAVIVAFIVSYTGIIGFIGLICPHIIRLVIGSDNRFVIPAACAFGGAFLLFADTLAKYMSSLDTIPVGAVCSLIGAPIFLIILIHNRRGIW